MKHCTVADVKENPADGSGACFVFVVDLAIITFKQLVEKVKVCLGVCNGLLNGTYPFINVRDAFTNFISECEKVDVFVFQHHKGVEFVVVFFEFFVECFNGFLDLFS